MWVDGSNKPQDICTHYVYSTEMLRLFFFFFKFLKQKTCLQKALEIITQNETLLEYIETEIEMKSIHMVYNNIPYMSTCI